MYHADMNEEKSPNFLTNPGVPELPEHTLASSAPLLPDSEAPRKLPRTVKRVARFSVLALVFTSILVFAPLVYGGLRAGFGAVAARSSLKEAQAAAQARQFSLMLEAVKQAESDLSEIRKGLNATGGWRVAPWIGSRLRAFEDVEKVGSSALAGFRELAEAAAAIQAALEIEGITDPTQTVAGSRSFQDLTPEEKRYILSQLDAAVPNMRRARERISIAAQAWERVPKDDLFIAARSALEPLADRLPELAGELDRAVALFEILLPLVGYPTERTYLVLLQNADELRATGGFIGNVGEITVEAADFKRIDFKDVYAVDNPVSGVWKEVPPEIMRRELGIPAWFLRDANWSPDYTLSAERVLDFYQRETKLGTGRDVPVDSVVALQPQFFRELLKLTGPLTVEGKTFDANNFFDQLQYDVEIGFLSAGIPVPQRKEVVEKLGNELLKKLTNQPASRWPEIVRIATDALTNKDILIYSRDRNLQSLLDARDWSGRTKTVTDDYLWVIDSNLAALKTDGVMDKQIIYSVDATDPAGPVATVRLRYVNTNRRIDWRYTRYRSYTRVYVPEGSELLSWSGVTRPDVYRELGKRVYGAFWTIEPGRTGELVYRYRLSPNISEKISSGTYELNVQKQPGSRASLTLDLAFGKKLLRATPAESPEQFGDTHYRQTDRPFDSDQLFSIEF